MQAKRPDGSSSCPAHGATSSRAGRGGAPTSVATAIAGRSTSYWVRPTRCTGLLPRSTSAAPPAHLGIGQWQRRPLNWALSNSSAAHPVGHLAMSCGPAKHNPEHQRPLSPAPSPLSQTGSR
eukprot:358942-Chlamydomonas_euryale.AAC.3